MKRSAWNHSRWTTNEIMQKRWIFKDQPNSKVVKELAQSLEIGESMATLLAQRGIDTFEEAKTFFRPSLQAHLHDPFLMQDMDKAVTRLEKALKNQEKILIYGDYDVDGTTSVSLVYGFLQQYHPHLDYYIPDRYLEGYGISKTSIDWAKENDFSLVIALDCGIKSVELMDYANHQGIDYIICDHHLPGDQIPKAHAVLDPKRKDCDYPFKELSGCGVGFKLMQAYCEKNDISVEKLYPFLDLLVISIACDIVPIVGENRVLAFYGLRQLNQTQRIGLKALIDVAKFSDDTVLNISNVIFGLGPRINAAGRIQHAKKAVMLLVSDNKREADYVAELINKDNMQRRDLDTSITEEALAMIHQDRLETAKTTVLFKENWHKGVIGIVASRCIESYHRPTVILTQHNGKATGSARSVPGFDLYQAIESCADLLEQFGGHMHAAGLTMQVENIEHFRKKFEEVVAQSINDAQLTPLIDIDAKLSLDDITGKFYRILQQFAPFGPANMRPVFVSEDLYAEYPKLLKEKHVKFRTRQKGSSAFFDAIGFGMPEHFERIANGEKFALCYSIDENRYRGQTSLQLRIKDIKFYD